MNMADIIIDKLEIRLRGISPQVARASIEGMGDTLLEHLADQYNPSGKRELNISKIDSGILKVRKETSPLDMKKMISSRVAESIASKIN